MSEFNEEIQKEDLNINDNNQTIYEHKKNKQAIKVAKAIIYVLVTAILCGVCSYVSVNIALEKAQERIVVYEDKDATTITEAVISDISETVKQISSSVVEVYTEQTVYSSFIGSYISSGAGSGVIISKDGYIITNYHVIENANTITVKTTDSVTHEATLIGGDEPTDIAVLKIEGSDLNAAVFGNSDSLLVGQRCIAIGNPLGTLGGTVTDGIISALEREVTIEDKIMSLLQTNAAISPGNSGGGLFTIDGKLIGIVNAKNSSDSVEGIGFAIPINTAKKIAEDLIEYGYVKGRAVIGISCISVDSAQKAFSIGVSNYGVYVQTVNSQNALNAGLKAGDLIIKIEDKEISSYTQMQSVLLKYSAGDTIKLTILRNNKEVEISCLLSERSE